MSQRGNVEPEAFYQRLLHAGDVEDGIRETLSQKLLVAQAHADALRADLSALQGLLYVVRPGLSVQAAVQVLLHDCEVASGDSTSLRSVLVSRARATERSEKRGRSGR